MISEHPQQLSLGITLNDDCTFDNFYAVAPGNIQAVDTLKKISLHPVDNLLLIWGAPGSGLTHLMQAVCHEASCEKKIVQYLPLRDLIGYSAEDICADLDQTDVVCVDDIDSICGIKSWEQSLFHLYNQIKDMGNTLLIASHTSPPSLPIVLADLRSRVLGCVRYHLESLSDSDKQVAMTMRAAARGLELTGDVARFILSRASRETNDLFALLQTLDEASLQKQRKLTIPFIKEVLHF